MYWCGCPNDGCRYKECYPAFSTRALAIGLTNTLTLSIFVLQIMAVQILESESV